MSGRRGSLPKVALTGIATALAAASVTACAGNGPAELVGARPSRGQELISHYGCGSCHTIGGVQGANGKVGPELTHFGDYRYIVGLLPRTPQNTALWIEHPRKYLRQGVMPDLGVTPAQARDIAAYLYGQ